jgi:ABC-type dipeptide/oligopeptide/nickel transport system permease subunit
MRIAAIIVTIWLIFGVVAGVQRGYFGRADNCPRVWTTLATIVAGPLNFVGLNPKVACEK